LSDIYILGIETSCDETSASIVKNGREVLSNVISSQIDIHKEYGGVVPEIASRKHVELVIPVIDDALKLSGIEPSSLDAIAVTYGPGLVGALLVGVSAAKSISYGINKPLIAVHHIEGHIAANYIQSPQLKPPFICLVVSGGHSHIVLVSDYGEYEIMGRTRDDAAGEAFDKVARALGLGYPGGPLIDKYALQGNPLSISFPRVTFKDGSLDFSFSGVKTSVLNYLNSSSQKGEEINIYNVCAAFQSAVVDILVENTVKAAQKTGINKICLAGGVAANSQLRTTFSEIAKHNGMEFYYPSMSLCTDNAAMIACAGYYDFLKGNFADLTLNAVPNLKLGERFIT